MDAHHRVRPRACWMLSSLLSVSTDGGSGDRRLWRSEWYGASSLVPTAAGRCSATAPSERIASTTGSRRRCHAASSSVGGIKERCGSRVRTAVSRTSATTARTRAALKADSSAADVRGLGDVNLARVKPHHDLAAGWGLAHDGTGAHFKRFPGASVDHDDAHADANILPAHVRDFNTASNLEFS